MPVPRLSFFHVTAGLLAVLAVGTPSVSVADSLPSTSVPRVTVVGLRGEAWVGQPGSLRQSRMLHFHADVAVGDELTTGRDSEVQVLIGQHALLTLYKDSTVRLSEQTRRRPAVRVIAGEIRLAVARADQAIVVQTPTVSGTTYGSLLHIRVGQNQQSLPATMDQNAAARTQNVVSLGEGGTGKVERIHVFEGNIQVQSSPGRSSVTIQAGSGLDISDGQEVRVVTIPSLPAVVNPLSATAAHGLPPQKGIEGLIAREKTHAEAVQQTLMQVAETPRSQVDLGNVILSTSLGVTPPPLQTGVGAPGAAVSVPNFPSTLGASPVTTPGLPLFPPIPLAQVPTNVILPTTFGRPLSTAPPAGINLPSVPGVATPPAPPPVPTSPVPPNVISPTTLGIPLPNTPPSVVNLPNLQR